MDGARGSEGIANTSMGPADGAQSDNLAHSNFSTRSSFVRGLARSTGRLKPD